jgi:hypothetical protein
MHNAPVRDTTETMILERSVPHHLRVQATVVISSVIKP